MFECVTTEKGNCNPQIRNCGWITKAYPCLFYWSLKDLSRSYVLVKVEHVAAYLFCTHFEDCVTHIYLISCTHSDNLFKQSLEFVKTIEMHFPELLNRTTRKSILSDGLWILW